MKFEEIEIDSIKKIDIDSNSILVLSTKLSLTSEDRKSIANEVSKVYGCKAMILDSCLDLSCVLQYAEEEDEKEK